MRRAMTHLCTIPGTAPTRSEPVRRGTYACVGLVWGMITSFSAAITPDRDSGMVYMGLGLLLALVATLLAGQAAASFTGWVGTAIGILVTAHVAAASISGVVNASSSNAVLRYALLLPAMGVMVAATRRDSHAQGLRLGLTAAGVAFVAYHLPALRLGDLLDPNSRLSLFLNTNSVGFISAMTGVSVLTLLRNQTRLKGGAGWAVVGACCLLCIATKSRTALLAGLSGGLIVLYRRARESRRVMAVVVTGVAVVAVAAFFTETGRRAATTVSELYMLHDQHRSIETGTSRYLAWSYVLREQWLPNAFFGMGPGRHNAALESAVGISSAHNGVLSNLAEVGVAGTLPLLLALGLGLARARGSTNAEWALPIVVTGIVESLAETMFFSMGSSASLLFLLGVAALASSSTRRSPAVRAA